MSNDENPHPLGTKEHYLWELDRHNSSVFGSRFELWASQERVSKALSEWSKIARARFEKLLGPRPGNSG